MLSPTRDCNFHAVKTASVRESQKGFSVLTSHVQSFYARTNVSLAALLRRQGRQKRTL